MSTPQFAPPPGKPPPASSAQKTRPAHTNQVIEAGRIRAQDEQEMQNLLQTVQMQMGIYNSEIEPEHDTDYYCGCGACQYKRAKRNRMRTHDIWSKATKYPGEKTFNDLYGGNTSGLAGSGMFLRNPYQARVVSPYGRWGSRSAWYQPRPDSQYHMMAIHQTIDLNKELNEQAQAAIDAKEPRENIWGDNAPPPLDFSNLSISEPTENKKVVPSKQSPEDAEMERAIQESLQDKKPAMSSEDEELNRAIQESLNDQASSSTSAQHDSHNPFMNGTLAQNATTSHDSDEKRPLPVDNGHTAHAADEKRPLPPNNNEPPRGEKGGRDALQPPQPTGPMHNTVTGGSTVSSASSNGIAPKKAGRFARLFGSSETRQAHKAHKIGEGNRSLAVSIVQEEAGRWPNAEWRRIVAQYQLKTGMAKKVAHLRQYQPIQYLHLLRAGYFEPIPVAWADLPSNPLKFSIEPAGGWRGITPAWRGYEDTAEERLYWTLNHREGATGTRLKPDFISALNLARERMASAVPPPPEYSSPDDQCHIQHTSEGYSRQVMPTPFRAYDRPEVASDDTMILLDVSSSMDFDPLRPIYDRYLVTGYQKSTQPKNKDTAQAIIRRFTDAMINHDHMRRDSGYDLVTFSTHASYIGRIAHDNFERIYSKVRIGGGTRVMTGWQKVKELHFEKHRESATWHPIYGWQAGPSTPMLRLLLLLDGEAQDMDEFELDLLGLSWAHVTIFLIGVDGCPHHHRHANELQRISDVNHHVSFVDAQGNTPERFVTHELLKRHLGINISMSQFQALEQLPAYTA